MYKAKGSTKLSTSRIAALDEVGFNWTRKRDWSRRKVVIALEESAVPMEMTSDQHTDNVDDDDNDDDVSESVLLPHPLHLTHNDEHFFINSRVDSMSDN